MILDGMEDSSAAMTVDARGLVTGWSDGARRLTGHAAEEVVGRPARDLLARGAPTRPCPAPTRRAPPCPAPSWSATGTAAR